MKQNPTNMNEGFKKTLTVLFGDPQKTLLEHRVFNATLFLVFLAGILSAIENVVGKNTLITTALTLIAAVSGFAVYWASRRTGKWQILVFPTYLFYIALLAFCWIQQGGILGGICYYFFILSAAAIIVFDGIKKIIALGAIASSIIPLVLIDYYEPELIHRYTTVLQQYLDLAFSLILCLIVNGLMALFLFNEYQRERTGKNAVINELTKEKMKVEDTVIAKQRLLSMVSHDISNAIFVINNASRELDNCVFDVKGKTGIAHIHSAVSKVFEIIESVQLVEASDAGRLAIDLKRVDVLDVVQNACFIYSDKFVEKNISLKLNVSSADPIAIIVEPTIFRNHVLSNVLMNAIKFSHPGSQITIKALKTESEVVLSISDTGIGIPSHQMEHLFLPGKKVAREGTVGEPGSGLGLPVVKSFMEMFNGRIEIESKAENEFPENHGTSVHLYCKAGA
jgi:signal transduction histidine kinase